MVEILAQDDDTSVDATATLLLSPSKLPKAIAGRRILSDRTNNASNAVPQEQAVAAMDTSKSVSFKSVIPAGCRKNSVGKIVVSFSVI